MYFLSRLVVAAIVIALQGGGLVASPIEQSFIDNTVIIGSGAVSGASDDLFRRVAVNRINNRAEPSLPDTTNLDEYDALIATESCNYVGWSGTLYATNGDGIVERTVLVVDCQDEMHKKNGGSLAELGLIADVSEKSKDIWHYRGYLVLEK